MTRSLSAENYLALQQRKLVSRDFIWFIVRELDGSGTVTDGYWSDVGSKSVQVIDPDTGGTVTRIFYGALGLISISDIQLVSDLTVQTVTVTLSQVSDRVNDLMRGYDCKQGKVQIFRGLFDPETREMVAPAIPRFAGTIDTAPIVTPKENEQGNVTLTCTGNTQELLRSNSDTRSDSSQKLRDETDNFYQDTITVSEWIMYWGKENGAIATKGRQG